MSWQAICSHGHEGPHDDCAGPQLSIGLREELRNPGHVQVGVFVGVKGRSRGKAGQVTMRTDEWDHIAQMLRSGLPVIVDEAAP